MMFYYRHHIGDFMRDTARLTDAQTIAYLRLLWLYYDTEKPLPDTPDKLAFQIGADPQNVRLILEHFFQLRDGFWHQERCEKEISAFRQKADSAQKSANARWKNANALRTQSGRNADELFSDANQEPITNNQKPIKTLKVTEIVDLYHECLPELAKVMLLKDDRRKKVKARFLEMQAFKKWNSGEEALAWFRAFFGVVRQTEWMMGQNDRGWKADFDYLFSPRGFRKIVESAS